MFPSSHSVAVLHSGQQATWPNAVVMKETKFMELQNACLQRLRTDIQAANAGLRYGIHNVCCPSLHVQPAYLCVLMLP